MGKAYRDLSGLEGQATTDLEMRLLCQRPGKKDAEGKPLYFTEQHHKRECDINYIIKKYDKTGLITHISKIEGEFGDLSGLDFKVMQDKVANAKTMFEMLPSKIRKEFKNNPYELLSFMDDEKNREKAIALGLINRDWTEETDGIGEHVKIGENVDSTLENVAV